MYKIEKSNFKRLIGNWKTEGIIFNDKGNSKLMGTDSYKFILDGNFILHEANVKMGDKKSETFEIIELVNSLKEAKMHYFNSSAESGIMTCTLINNNFTILGEKIKFEGIIHEDNTELIGKWILQNKQNEWINFIDLKLTKQ